MTQRSSFIIPDRVVTTHNAMLRRKENWQDIVCLCMLRVYARVRVCECVNACMYACGARVCPCVRVCTRMHGGGGGEGLGGRGRGRAGGKGPDMGMHDRKSRRCALPTALPLTW